MGLLPSFLGLYRQFSARTAYKARRRIFFCIQQVAATYRLLLLFLSVLSMTPIITQSNRALGALPKWDFLKIRIPYFGLLIIRIPRLRVLY